MVDAMEGRQRGDEGETSPSGGATSTETFRRQPVSGRRESGSRRGSTGRGRDRTAGTEPDGRRGQEGTCFFVQRRQQRL